MYPPPAVGEARERGLALPSWLPQVGASVLDAGGVLGVVGHYEFRRGDQRWFPVRFGLTYRQRRLGAAASLGGGYVKLHQSKVVALDRARKPPQERPAAAAQEAS